MATADTRPQSAARAAKVVSLAASDAGLPSNLGRMIVEDADVVGRLVVIRLPLPGLARILESFRHLQLGRLSTPHLYALTEQLLSLFEFQYTPTTSAKVPIRIDVLIERVCGQPPGFLDNLLKRVTEWFGFAPDPAVHHAWVDITLGRRDDIQLPGPLDTYQRQGLAAVIGDEVVVPLVALAAWRAKSQLPDWDTLPGLLHEMRHSLLGDNLDEARHGTYYRQVTSFMLDLSPSLEGHQYRMVRARGELVDLSKVDWTAGVSQSVVEATLVALQALFDSDRHRYRQAFNRVHGRLWDKVYEAVKGVSAIEQSTGQLPLTVDRTDWAASCRVVSRTLKSIAEAYALLTELEESLGVDRYLGSKVIERDLERVHSIVRRIGDQAQVALSGARQLYLRQWNLSQLGSIILGLLGIGEQASSLAEYFPTNRQRVIFLLLDALGYTQFHWFLRTVAEHSYSPLGGNIFDWLIRRNALNDTYSLASNPVGVTGGCLPTIYTGALPRETGLVGSHMLMEGRVLNVLKGYEESYGSPLSSQDIAEIYRRQVNWAVTPVAETARRDGVDVRIFHGGPARFSPLTEYIYGELAHDSRRMHTVSQPDRVFSDALGVLQHWERERARQGLALIYYPPIDSSGHHYGPYTQFQATGLAKLNFLFTHFMVELVERCQTFFDGATSVVISADHGMFESSSNIVSQRMIRAGAGNLLPDDAVIIYDNRACYIYGVARHHLDSVKSALDEFFAANGFAIEISTRRDELVRELIWNPDEPHGVNCPDLILQFYGPGVFYRKENLDAHMFLYGAHGGSSVEETFVPLIHFSLTPELASALKRLYR